MSSGNSPERLYLIDAHALLFQVFHAVSEMSSPAGLPTNALFGFTQHMLHLRLDKKPDYLLCAFDVPGQVFREKIYPAYKAHREPPPNDLELQIPQVYRLLQAMRVPILGQEGFEADDVIATVATAAAQRGLEVFICTSDKDCRQLLSDHIRIYNLRKHELFDQVSLLEDWGIAPEQVIDLQALVGDSVDNVPGVPGIGIKTASKLLQEFKTLDNVLANVDRIPGPKRQENLRAAGPKVALSRQLVRLRTDVPLKLDWEAWRVKPWDSAQLLELFREWGFRRFADQVRALAAQASPAKESQPRQRQLFPEAEEEPPATPKVNANGQLTTAVAGSSWEAQYDLVDTPNKFRSFFQKLQKQTRIAVDLETTSLEPRQAEIVGYAFCWKPGRAWYLPVRGPDGADLLDPAETLSQLRPVLEDPKVAKVNQNIKYDLMVLRQQRVTLAGVSGDPMIADYLLHAGERNHNMEVLAQRYLNHQVIPITDLIGKKGKNQLRMDQVATAKVAQYSGEDADVAWRLTELLEPQLAGSGLATLYRDLEVPLIQVLAELEFNGIRLDVPFLKRLSGEMAQQLAKIEEEIYRLAGHSFNIASPKQLRQVLFEELKLPEQRKTGITGEASTNQESLERLAGLGHPLPKKILEHRHIAKLKGTYVDALPELVNPATGRVHTSFNQTVAATGRLSASDPNLQNIPARTEQGRQIRQAFLPEPDWLLLTADYSQIELRLLAHFSGDEALRRAFAEDRDIHGAVAAQTFGVPEKDVTKEMRRVAKTINFGVIYGISSHGLAPRLEISREEAARYIDAYFARHPKVLQYQNKILADCRKKGYVSTILGRRRAISGIRPDSTYQQRNQPEREAINMEIQGSAADLIKVAMLNIYRRLKRENRRSRMLLQIHDELVFEVPRAELKPVAEMVRQEMTQALADRLQVPLKVDQGGGPNWLEVEALDKSVSGSS
jgi:DNA polymerase-1